MKYLNNYGLWNIDEIKVKVINDHLAWIDYKKYIINAETHRIVANVGFFERRKGMTLENKIHDSLTSLRNKLMKDNEKIKLHKEIENKFN